MILKCVMMTTRSSNLLGVSLVAAVLVVAAPTLWAQTSSGRDTPQGNEAQAHDNKRNDSPIDTSYKVLTGHTSPIAAMCASSDGSTLVSVDLHGRVMVRRGVDFERVDGTFDALETRFVDHDKGTKAYEDFIDPSGEPLDTGLLFDCLNLDVLKSLYLSPDSFKEPLRISELKVNASGCRLLILGTKVPATLWDISQSGPVRKMRTFGRSGVQAATWVGESDFLVSIDADGRVETVNGESGLVMKRSIPLSHAGWVVASTDGAKLMVGGNGDSVSVFSSSTLELIQTHRCEFLETSFGAFSHDGKRAVFMGKNPNEDRYFPIELEASANGSFPMKEGTRERHSYDVIHMPIRRVSISHSGEFIYISSGGNEYQVRFDGQDSKDWLPPMEVRAFLFDSHRDQIVDMPQDDCRVAILGGKTLAVTSLLEGHALPVRASTWIGKSGSVVATGSDDLTIRLWRVGYSHVPEGYLRASPTGPLSIETAGYVDDVLVSFIGDKGFVLQRHIHPIDTFSVYRNDGSLIYSSDQWVGSTSPHGEYLGSRVEYQLPEGKGTGYKFVWITALTGQRFMEDVLHSDANFSGDDRVVLQLGDAGHHRLYRLDDMSKGSVVFQPDGSVRSDIVKAVLDHRGDRIAVAYANKSIGIYDSKSMKKLAFWGSRAPVKDDHPRTRRAYGHCVRSLQFCQDPDLLLVNWVEGGIQVLDTKEPLGQKFLPSFGTLLKDRRTWSSEEGPLLVNQEKSIVEDASVDRSGQHSRLKRLVRTDIATLGSYEIEARFPGIRGQELPSDFVTVPGVSWLLAFSYPSWLSILDSKTFETLLTWDAHSCGDLDGNQFERADPKPSCTGGPGDYQPSVLAACASADGKRIATFGGDKMLRIWSVEVLDSLVEEIRATRNLREGTLSERAPTTTPLPGGQFGSITGVKRVGNGGHYLTMHEDHILCIWDAPSVKAKLLWTVTCPIAICNVQLSEDGWMVAAYNEEDERPRIWNWRANTLTFDGWGNATESYGGAMSPSGKYYAGFHDRGFAYRTTMGGGKPTVIESAGHGQHGGYVVWSQDSKHLLIFKDSSLIVIDVATGERVETVDLGRDFTSVSTSTYSSDGRWLVLIIENHYVYAMDVATWRAVRVPIPHSANGGAELFDPDASHEECWKEATELIRDTRGRIVVKSSSGYATLSMGDDPRQWTWNTSPLVMPYDGMEACFSIPSRGWICSTNGSALLVVDDVSRSIIGTIDTQLPDNNSCHWLLWTQDLALALDGAGWLWSVPLHQPAPLSAEESHPTTGFSCLRNGSRMAFFWSERGYGESEERDRVQAINLDTMATYNFSTETETRRSRTVEWDLVETSRNSECFVFSVRKGNSGHEVQVHRMPKGDGTPFGLIWSFTMTDSCESLAVSNNGWYVAGIDESVFHVWSFKDSVTSHHSRPITYDGYDGDFCFEFTQDSQTLVVAGNERISCWQSQDLAAIEIDNETLKHLQLVWTSTDRGAGQLASLVSYFEVLQDKEVSSQKPGDTGMTPSFHEGILAAIEHNRAIPAWDPIARGWRLSNRDRYSVDASSQVSIDSTTGVVSKLKDPTIVGGNTNIQVKSDFAWRSVQSNSIAEKRKLEAVAQLLWSSFPILDINFIYRAEGSSDFLVHASYETGDSEHHRFYRVTLR